METIKEMNFWHYSIWKYKEPKRCHIHQIPLQPDGRCRLCVEEFINNNPFKKLRKYYAKD